MKSVAATSASAVVLLLGGCDGPDLECPPGQPHALRVRVQGRPLAVASQVAGVHQPVELGDGDVLTLCVEDTFTVTAACAADGGISVVQHQGSIAEDSEISLRACRATPTGHAVTGAMSVEGWVGMADHWKGAALLPWSFELVVDLGRYTLVASTSPAFPDTTRESRAVVREVTVDGPVALGMLDLSDAFAMEPSTFTLANQRPDETFRRVEVRLTDSTLVARSSTNEIMLLPEARVPAGQRHHVFAILHSTDGARSYERHAELPATQEPIELLERLDGVTFAGVAADLSTVPFELDRAFYRVDRGSNANIVFAGSRVAAGPIQMQPVGPEAGFDPAWFVTEAVDYSLQLERTDGELVRRSGVFVRAFAAPGAPAEGATREFDVEGPGGHAFRSKKVW